MDLLEERIDRILKLVEQKNQINEELIRILKIPKDSSVDNSVDEGDK